MADGASVVHRETWDQAGEPERTDILPLVPRPLDRLGLFALLGLVTAALAWAFLGTVSRTVPGIGLLIAQGGQIVEAQAVGSGNLATISVHPGALVSAGQVVATVTAVDREQKLATAQARVAEKQAEVKRIADVVQKVAESRSTAAQLQRQALDAKLRATRDRAIYLADALSTQETLYERGFATRPRVAQAREDLTASKLEEANVLGALADLAARLAGENRNDAERIARAEEELGSALRAAAEQDATSLSLAQVLSPAAGRVIEIKAHPGAVIATGQPVVAVETGQSGLELLAFFPSQQAREVRPQMDVRISPAGTRKEEHGQLLGTVMDITDFPLSGTGLRSLLQNETLVQEINRQGPPHLARIALRTHAKDPNLYAWTAHTGETIALSSGTSARLEVVSSLHRPIDLALPRLRSVLGL